MIPIKLKAEYKEYLWGGTRLKELYNKECDLQLLAESWELAIHKDGECTVNSGKHIGRTFREYLFAEGIDVLGTKCPSAEIPISIKLIDAKENLSIQVHPDDRYALKNENQKGKTEMWLVLEAEENAMLYYGVNRKISRKELIARTKNNDILEVLDHIAVKKGDMFFVDAKTIHAIGKGILVYEIQQNSNITYRLYDYNRRDKFNKLRELHIKKATDVASVEPVSIRYKGYEVTQDDENAKISIICQCDYFKTVMYTIKTYSHINMATDSFAAMTVIEGVGILSREEFSMSIYKGETIFIPAEKVNYDICGDCQVLVSSL